jgi:hypothetical protein
MGEITIRQAQVGAVCRWIEADDTRRPGIVLSIEQQQLDLQSFAGEK